ncbi:MAG: PH domain-containing protein [Actinobacteria bacterium]|nr:PH domain-containing protein [Actinomycetota bacterium]
MSESRQAARPTVVTARPVRAVRYAVLGAVAVLALFGVAALILRSTSDDGVGFTTADQVGIAGTGLVVALLILSITRPRLRADANGVDCRGFFSGYRHVDWELVTAVEFPPKARFARLVVPGDELIPLYAVQRGDGERSVAVMQGLRALYNATRPQPTP